MSDENYGKEGTAKPAKRKAKETKQIKVCCSYGVAALSSVTLSLVTLKVLCQL